MFKQVINLVNATQNNNKIKSLNEESTSSFSCFLSKTDEKMCESQLSESPLRNLFIVALCKSSPPSFTRIQR